MELAALLRLPAGLQLLNGTVLEAAVGVEVCSQRLTSPCPRCSCLSERVHSYYTRTLADVPCAGQPLRITLRVRKFRCLDRRCPQHVFTERLPDYVRPWARKTIRLVEQMTSLGMAAGGRGTETVAPALGMQVSDQTVLRLLARCHDPTAAPVCVLGVDDFGATRSRMCSCKDSRKEVLTWGSAPSTLPG
jgi:zinc-finger of transposase IS204/IS1001/IS1096/IS1165